MREHPEIAAECLPPTSTGDLAQVRDEERHGGVIEGERTRWISSPSDGRDVEDRRIAEVDTAAKLVISHDFGTVVAGVVDVVEHPQGRD